MNWRKINRVLHRDFGYFFFGMTIIYAISGIALNHLKDWNPSYIVETENIQVELTDTFNSANKNEIISLLKIFELEDKYKSHYLPSVNELKIFLDGGSVIINLPDGSGIIEKVKRRPLFHSVNFLHYNPGKLWTYFSDIFCGALILLSITGLFIVKGKNSIKGRGAYLTLLGIIIPIIFLIF